MFNIRLKQLREEAGYSQYTFAKKIGCAQSTVGGWESGVREPNFKTLQKIADFFHVSTDYLLGKTDQTTPHKKNTAGDGVTKEIIKDLLNKANNQAIILTKGESGQTIIPLSEEEVQLVTNLVETLRKQREHRNS